MKFNKQFAKCAGVAALAMTTITGCASTGFGGGGGGFHPTPRQASQIGQGICTIGGAAAGAALTRNSDNVSRAVASAVGGIGARRACGAAFETRAASQGHCRQRVVYGADGSQRVTSTCDRQTAYPRSVAPPR